MPIYRYQIESALPTELAIQRIHGHGGTDSWLRSGRAWRSRNGRCRSLRNIPAATQRFDQLDTRRHLFHPEVHRRPLIAQQSDLRGNHIEITVHAGLIAGVGERQVATIA